MAGIAFGAHFLVSPVLVIGQPSSLASAISSPVRVPARLGIIPMTVFMPREQQERRSLELIVADQVRQQLDEQPDPIKIPWTDDVVISTDPEGVQERNAAVVAAHADRIRFLKEQLAAAKVHRSVLPPLAELRARLRRAEAAQGLALARLNSQRELQYSAWSKQAATANTDDSLPVSVTTGFSERIGMASGAPSAKRLLEHAKLSLRTARTALTTQVHQPKRFSIPPRIVLGGLLQWDGSESWSLARI